MRIVSLLFGVLFGLLLSGSKLVDYNVIHQGLLLHNGYVYLLMGSSTIVGLAILWILEKKGWKTPLGGPLKIRRLSIQRRHIIGGILFGVGWAITGTCPAVSAAQLGSGMLCGLIVMIGLFCGTLLRDLSARK
jgi:uncharacterized membrane protein YedE/YeeE